MLDGERAVPLAVAMTLPLDVVLLTTRFLGAMVDLEEVFLGSFSFFEFLGKRS